MTAIGINGFGRIGRNVLRAAQGNAAFDVKAINDIADTRTLAHLLKYDSNYGPYPGEVHAEDNHLIVDDRRIQVTCERDPANLPWKDLGVEVALECSGHFNTLEGGEKHLQAGAKKVFFSAPAKGEGILTVVMGVNSGDYDRAKHNLISNASCTTNCLAPVVKVLHETFGVKHGLMNTIHAYTNDQNTLDMPHSDLRRARAAGLSMIPTSTGAAKAMGLVMPELKGKLDGLSIRVPRSSVVDAPSTTLVGENMVKVLSWYDNEWGFSNRMVDMATKVL
jgi:glyceraldehyde 3-phosphate dehydrogenase